MKRITDKDRIKQIFMEADETQSHVLLEMAQLIVEMRYAGMVHTSAKPVVKRGRPVGASKVNGSVAVARTPGAATILGEAE